VSQVTSRAQTNVGVEAETLATALEREHREIDEAIEAFLASGEDGGRLESLTQAMQALRRHIFLEEEFLFPPLCDTGPLHDAGLAAPVLVMLREHGELWRTMESIERELGEDEAQLSLQARCKLLLAQLDRHNSKEEPILYPHSDSVLGAPASAELKAFLERGRMPEGWVRAAA
jgi:regulator of cell morphogenesis and NO signaling